MTTILSLDEYLATAPGPENTCRQCERKLHGETEGLCVECCSHDECESFVCLACGKDTHHGA